MERYNVTPLVGFNEARFGMKRSEIRSILGAPLKEFKKSKFSETTTDDFTSFHVYYDKEDKCEAVEFFEGVEVVVDGNAMFSQDINGMMQLPFNFSRDADGLISTEYAIGIYAPQGQIESILFGIKGYYE